MSDNEEFDIMKLFEVPSEVREYFEIMECIRNNYRGIERVQSNRATYYRGNCWVRICPYGNTHLSDETAKDSYYGDTDSAFDYDDYYIYNDD